MLHDTHDEVMLPDAPAIAGLRFRLYRGEEDYPAMAAVHEGRRMHDDVRPAIYGDWAEITEVNVSLRWRRRGRARALLTRAVVTLRERGIATILLHTRADNPHGAPDLYRSVGFRAVKEHIRYRRKPMW